MQSFIDHARVLRHPLLRRDDYPARPARADGIIPYHKVRRIQLRAWCYEIHIGTVLAHRLHEDAFLVL
ncbi:hypothetical protein C5746_34070 [Streptomyces atratus]|uniref:Uncharacterized protein n=1 Tax=Streptomyces atratus TaxID=1893 RepID=A0A2Z5JLF7_STRAR|nr:hypothetical protein C5746_34070 [Streptomyces atratus]